MIHIEAKGWGVTQNMLPLEVDMGFLSDTPEAICFSMIMEIAASCRPSGPGVLNLHVLQTQHVGASLAWEPKSC